MSRGVVGTPGVGQEIAPGLQQRRGNLVVHAPEVILEIEIRGTLVVDQGHVIDTLEGHVQVVVIRLEIGEIIGDLTLGLGHVLVKEEGVTNLVHVPENDIAEVTSYRNICTAHLFDIACVQRSRSW